MSLELRRRLQVIGDRVRAIRGVPLECIHTGIAGDRESPHESLRFTVGGRDAMLCYGRPFAQGREVFGALVPWDELWRAGANEPTTLYLPFAAEVAGLRVKAGWYSLYLVPGREESRVVLNRSIRQSGRTRQETGRRGNVFPNAYTPVVQSFEVGRAAIVQGPCEYQEQLLVTADAETEARTLLHFAWERMKLPVPITRRA